MDELDILAFVMIPLLVLAIFGNVNIVAATIFFKELRHRSNILVTIIALLDLVCLFYNLFKFK